jgi:hypothetical protein
MAPNPTIIGAAVSMKNSELKPVFDRLRELLAADAPKDSLPEIERRWLAAPATRAGWGS